MTGPIIFSLRKPRRQLENEGYVYTFRTTDRTTGKTWWRKSRTGQKEGDVYVLLVEEVSKPLNLDQWVNGSGFDSVSEWRKAIGEFNGGEIPTHGYIYLVEKLVTVPLGGSKKSVYHTTECKNQRLIENAETVAEREAKHRGLEECQHCRGEVGGTPDFSIYNAAKQAGKRGDGDD